jgi:hypothetical protein
MKDQRAHRRTGSPTSSDLTWRETRLRVAGFEWETASRLAREEAVDLHALLELVDRGCPPHLAACILAPLESDRSPC